MPQFAEVLLPLPIQGSYTYRIPDEMREQVAIGSRVLVPFGPKKIYTAIVVMQHNNETQGYRVKEQLAVLDKAPIVRHP